MAKSPVSIQRRGRGLDLHPSRRGLLSSPSSKASQPRKCAPERTHGLGGGGDVADGGRWAAVGVERRAESPHPHLAALQPLVEAEESVWFFRSQRCVVWETAREDRRNEEAAKAVPDRKSTRLNSSHT